MGMGDDELTGMILLPGSFSGRMSSPRPQRGPLEKRKGCKTPKYCNFKVFRKRISLYNEDGEYIQQGYTFLTSVHHCQSS